MLPTKLSGLPIVLSIVLLALIGGLIFWQSRDGADVNTPRTTPETSIVETSDQPATSANTNESNTIETKPETKPINPNETTYTNPKYKFSFSYPKTYSLKEDVNNPDFFIATLASPKKDYTATILVGDPALSVWQELPTNATKLTQVTLAGIPSQHHSKDSSTERIVAANNTIRFDLEITASKDQGKITNDLIESFNLK